MEHLRVGSGSAYLGILTLQMSQLLPSITYVSPGPCSEVAHLPHA